MSKLTYRLDGEKRGKYELGYDYGYHLHFHSHMAVG